MQFLCLAKESQFETKQGKNEIISFPGKGKREREKKREKKEEGGEERGGGRGRRERRRGGGRRKKTKEEKERMNFHGGIIKII